MYFLRVSNSEVSSLGIVRVLVFSFLRVSYSSAKARIWFWRVSISLSFCWIVRVWVVSMSGLIPLGMSFSLKVLLV